MQETNNNCPVCELNRQRTTISSGRFYVDCRRCGSFRIDQDLVEDLGSYERQRPGSRTRFSHYIRRMKREISGQSLPYADDDFHFAIESYVASSVSEQFDDALLALSELTKTPSASYKLSMEDIQSSVRAYDREDVYYLFQHLHSEGYVENAVYASPSTVDGLIEHTGRITFKGWLRVEELKRSKQSSRDAFMAMKFGDAELNQFLENVIRPTVSKTGFRLLKLDDEPKAGLIDDRMRLQIKSSRFLLADLSHGNKGAYWEAGYAEGLGKPVIYLCKQAVFDDESSRPHFDTNHHLTVIWDAKKPDDFASRLKATIRFSIPEARQVD
jgi:hypothetical protein